MRPIDQLLFGTRRIAVSRAYENIYSLLSCVGEKETLLREVDSVDLPGGRVNSFLGFLSPLERCPTVHPHADVSACFLKLPFVRVRLVLGRICCRDAYLKREIHIQTCARIFRRFRDVVFRQLVNQIYQIQTGMASYEVYVDGPK